MAVNLVTGGVRSGKSRFAEHILLDVPDVTFVAPHQPQDGDRERDPEWAARVEHHRATRPGHWRTVETLDVAALLWQPGGAVLFDCVGTWLTGIVDRAGLWGDLAAARELVQQEGAALAAALRATRRLVVVVTNEVGWSLVPDNPAGRFFQDELGRLNAQLAALTRMVFLVVAGRVIELGEAPAVPPRRDPADRPDLTVLADLARRQDDAGW